MNPDMMQKLDDMLILDAMSRAVLTPTLSATERAHLHHTHALCMQTCPAWEWTLYEHSGRLEARSTSLVVELHLSPFTLRWNGVLRGLVRHHPAEQIHYVQGASAMEVLLGLLVALTTITDPAHEPTQR